MTVQGLLDEGAQVDAPAVELQVARFDLGDVQHGIDELREAVNVPVHGAQDVALVLCDGAQDAVEDQAEAFLDGGQRGAEFVTDLGDKVGDVGNDPASVLPGSDGIFGELGPHGPSLVLATSPIWRASRAGSLTLHRASARLRVIGNLVVSMCEIFSFPRQAASR